MLTVNLFDDCFRHAFCSTGWKKPQHIEYVRDRMEFDGITLFTDGYINDPIVDQVKSRYKIGWLHEPQCLHPENYRVDVLSRFDFILTYYKPLLTYYEPLINTIPIIGPNGQRNPYIFAPYGGVWIDRQHWGMRPKTKLVSMLYGNKLSTPGQRTRHEIANAVRPLGMVDFYGFEGEPVDYSSATKLKVLGDYAFSIVCEACWEENLFTEILLDCFAVGTIPIFWGCPNIGEFFWSDGMIRLSQGAEEVNFLIDNLRFKRYYEMIGAIQDNLNRVAAYEITEDWLYHNVLRGLV